MANHKLVRIEEYPGYSVGSDGHIYSHLTLGVGKGKIDYGRISKLKGVSGRGGQYLQVSICNKAPKKSGKNHKIVTLQIHLIVCAAFHGPKPGPKYVARHLNDNKQDNRAENIAWGTYSDNAQDALINGKTPCGMEHTKAKFNSIDDLRAVFVLKNLGVTHESIADVFGCSVSTINKISTGKAYKKELSLLN